jgi:hypothetical protein
VSSSFLIAAMQPPNTQFTFALATHPILAGMGGVVIDNINNPFANGIPADAAGVFDLSTRLIVANLTGTEVLEIFKSGSTTPGETSISLSMAAPTVTALAGTDLAYDGTARTVTSTAGGVFIATKRFDGGWD